MTKLTESQFHTVWTEAVGREGYNKNLFKEVLSELIANGHILKNADYLDAFSITEIETYLRRKKLNKLNE